MIRASLINMQGGPVSPRDSTGSDSPTGDEPGQGQIATARTIDPAAWYSDRDVFLTWDVSREVQDQARRAGRLHFVQSGASILYKGAWLQEWFGSWEGTQGNNPDGNAVPVRRLAKPTPSRSTVNAGQSAPSPKAVVDPEEHWKAAVEARQERGLTLSQAIKATIREKPALAAALNAAAGAKP